MKKLLTVTAIILFFAEICYAQTDTIDYFGQTTPGDSAVKFAPGFISKDDRYEGSLTFSPNGKECLLPIFDGSNWQWADIYYSIYDGEWSNFEKAEFMETSKYLDIQPIFSPDGQTLYYSSLRPYKGYTQPNIFVNIWKIKRDSSGWKEPEKLNSVINTTYYDDTCPAITSSGTLYFGKDQTHDIWYSKLEDGEYKNIQKAEIPINSDNRDGQPYIAPDESYMILCSDRSGGFGQSDLYIAYRKENEKWTNPKNLGGKINSGEREEGPRISPDGKYLFLCRFKRSAYSDIYWANADFIEKLKYTNFIPYVLKLIPDTTLNIEQDFNYKLSDSVFVDDDGNKTLTYSARLSLGDSLPAWLNFIDSTLTFYGIPPAVEVLEVEVTATDSAGANVSDIFRITIKNSTNIENTLHDTPQKFQLNQNYPNPFNPSTNIHYALGKSSHAKLTIHNIFGQKIKTLANAFLNAGEHSIVWDATDSNNIQVSSGIYVCQLECDGYRIAKKMLYLK
jgi:Tol biopolymer transport system component